MSQIPSPKQLHNAILSNSAALVEKYLEAGVDPNLDLAPVVPALASLKYTDSDGKETIPKEVKVANAYSSRHSAPCALHLAVINAYHSYDGADTRSGAYKILLSLLKCGANPLQKAQNMCLCNIEGYLYNHVQEPVTPCDLAVFLKQFLSSVFRVQHAQVLDKVIEILSSHAETAGYANIPTSPVPKVVINTWKKLLFSSEFSDVKFVSEDGTTLHAHKAVLAAASPYFSTLFHGPWTENNRDGTFRTSNSSEIMKAVLSFIYTGNVNLSLIDSDPRGMLSVSSEYNLEALRFLAEASCIRALSSANIKDVLQLAHLHSSATLKEACFVFVRRHACNVLTDPIMMSLAAEDSDLWEELTAAIATGRRVKQRTK